MDVTIRPMTVEDTAAVGVVHVRAWQAAYRGAMPDDYLDALRAEDRANMWRSIVEADRPGIQRKVIEVETGIVGFAVYGVEQGTVDDPAVGELIAINLDPDHWRQRLGRTLLRHVTAELADLGYRRAVLWVVAENTRAGSSTRPRAGCSTAPNGSTPSRAPRSTKSAMPATCQAESFRCACGRADAYGAAAEFGASQHGALSRSQATRIGLSPRHIHRLIDLQLIRERLPGVLVFTCLPVTTKQEPWIATHASGGGFVAGFESAAWLHGLDGFDGEPPPIEVIGAPGRRLRGIADAACAGWPARPNVSIGQGSRGLGSCIACWPSAAAGRRTRGSNGWSNAAFSCRVFRPGHASTRFATTMGGWSVGSTWRAYRSGSVSRRTASGSTSARGRDSMTRSETTTWRWPAGISGTSAGTQRIARQTRLRDGSTRSSPSAEQSTSASRFRGLRD